MLKILIIIRNAMSIFAFLWICHFLYYQFKIVEQEKVYSAIKIKDDENRAEFYKLLNNLTYKNFDSIQSLIAVKNAIGKRYYHQKDSILVIKRELNSKSVFDLIK